MNTTLIVPPFLGEIGWLFFAWEPMVRYVYKYNIFEKCIVYGPKGYDKVFPYAEYREYNNIPERESECLLWNRMNDEMRKELNSILEDIVKENQEDFDGFDIFWYNNLKSFNTVPYESIYPNIIPYTNKKKYKDALVLCVRDRALSTFRNWSKENWIKLSNKLLKNGHKVVLLGKVRENDWETPEGVINLLNKTTINDCIDVLGSAKCAVGGSTGLLHLASRVGTDHFVWGTEKNVIRYLETNWHGAKHNVIPTGWCPEVDTVYDNLMEFLNNE